GFHDTFHWGDEGGFLQVRNGRSRALETPDLAEPQAELYDCDILRDAFAGHASRNIPVKSAPICYNSATGYAGWTTRIPPFSRIKAVYARQVGAQGTTSYRLRIGNGDRSNVYAQSVTAPQNSPHTAMSDVLLFAVGTSNVDRVIRVWADSGVDGVPPIGETYLGYMEAWVEYY
ncbi:MAG TPA: hypothetical protein VF883_13370, partial [Thermoanaerobaculia bacterium]